MYHVRRWKLVAKPLGLVLGVAGLGLTLAFAGTPATARPVELQLQPPECPLPRVFAESIRTRGVRYYSPNAVDAERIADIPEYHDCQRLVEGATYGPLTAVYAKYRLETVWDTLLRLDSIPILRLRRPGDLDRLRDSVVRATAQRIVANAAAVGGPAPSQQEIAEAGAAAWQVYYAAVVTQTTRKALLAAAVRSWDGPYTPLAIGTGWNCLYLFDTQRPNPRAKMIQYGPAVNDCADRITADTTGPGITELAVNRVVVPGALPDDYPPVARWEWDATAKQQYIGIMCDAWCEVGPFPQAGGNVPGRLVVAATVVLTPEAGYDGTSFGTNDIGPSLAERRRERIAAIKGWFDQEQLAPAKPRMGGAATATRGTLFPSPALGSLNTVRNFATGNWVHVASVALSGYNAAYAGKFNFYPENLITALPYSLGQGPTLDQRALTRIEMCKGDRCAPELNEDFPCVWPDDPDQPQPPKLADRWWARIVTARGWSLPPGFEIPGGANGQASGSAVLYKCVIRRGHEHLKHDDGTPVEVPGTARWRWMKDDQTVWVRCDLGCCEVIQ